MAVGREGNLGLVAAVGFELRIGQTGLVRKAVDRNQGVLVSNFNVAEHIGMLLRVVR